MTKSRQRVRRDLIDRIVCAARISQSVGHALLRFLRLERTVGRVAGVVIVALRHERDIAAVRSPHRNDAVRVFLDAKQIHAEACARTEDAGESEKRRNHIDVRCRTVKHHWLLDHRRVDDQWYAMKKNSKLLRSLGWVSERGVDVYV